MASAKVASAATLPAQVSAPVEQVPGATPGPPQHESDSWHRAAAPEHMAWVWVMAEASAQTCELRYTSECHRARLNQSMDVVAQGITGKCLRAAFTYLSV